jgi:hypothetical protein
MGGYEVMMDSKRLRAAPGVAAWLTVIVSVCVVVGLEPWRAVVQAQKSPWPPWYCVLMLRGCYRVTVSTQSGPGRERDREERHARMERVESCRASEGGRVRWLGQPSVASQGSWAKTKAIRLPSLSDLCASPMARCD